MGVQELGKPVPPAFASAENSHRTPSEVNEARRERFRPAAAHQDNLTTRRELTDPREGYPLRMAQQIPEATLESRRNSKKQLVIVSSGDSGGNRVAALRGEPAGCARMQGQGIRVELGTGSTLFRDLADGV